MIDPTEILSDIDGEIKSSPPAPPRSNSAASIRAILKKVVQWIIEQNYIPSHTWVGTAIRFVNANGTPGDLVDLKGEKGNTGNTGWTPVFSNILDGQRIVQRVTDWIGGEGPKPDVTPALYVSASGYTSVIANAIDIRGGLGINWRGDWAASTVYAANDGVQNGGNSYRRLTAGTSGSTFDSSAWFLVAQGASAADGTITTQKLADGAATNAKLATQAVTPDKTSFIATTAPIEETVFNTLFSLVDENSNVLLKVTKDNILQVVGAFMSTLTTGKISLSSFSFETNSSSQLAVKINGLSALRIGQDGEVQVDTQTLSSASTEIYVNPVVDEAGNMTSYRKRTGELVESKVITNGLAIGGFSFQVTNGDLVIKSGTIEAIRFKSDGTVQISNLSLISDILDVYPFSYVDESGNIGQAFTRKGVSVGTSLTTAQSTTSGILADILHLPDNGQSLSIGAYGTPLQSTVAEDYVIGFTKGPTMADFDGDATQYNGFVPLVANIRESPVTALARMFKQQLATDGFVINNTDKRLEILASAPGFSGASIAQLSKGTANYQRFLDGITNGKRLANLAGKTYNMPSVFWMQGEANVNDSRDSYKSALIQLRKDIWADLKAANPSQKNELKWLNYQLAFHNKANNDAGAYPNIALALLDLALTEPNFYMGPVLYPYDYADDVHLANGLEYVKVGALAGYIQKRIVVDGVNWKPIYLKDYVIDGNILELRFYVPVAPLVFDTTTVVDPGNYGFRLFSGSTEQTITSVSLMRPDTVKIVTSNTITTGMKLTYAINGTLGKSGRTQGSRGCLRDSQGYSVIYQPGGLNLPLHNWCPIFEQYL